MIKAIAISIVVVGTLAAIFMFNSSSTEAPANEEQKQLSAVEKIERQVSSGEAVLLDVRSQVEFDLSHASPAQLFNIEWLKAGQRPDISKDQIVYVYCHSGNRSSQAAGILSAEGYMVVDLGAFTNWTDDGGQAVTSQLSDYETQLAEMGESRLEVLGNPDASVTVTKYADFMCPYCARYTLETEPQLLADYVETGKVKYEFRNVAYLGDESALAAVGGYCANEQGGFWSYQTAVTQSYNSIGEAAFTLEGLSGLVGDLNMDEVEFKTCLNSQKYDSVVSAETIAAQNSGFRATPSFTVNQQKVEGAVPYSVFKAAIDGEL